jgi:hypothetical protein
VADLIPNIAKGRGVELHRRVKANDPANSAIIVIPVSRGAVTDAQLRDAADFAAIVALGVTERTTGGWNRKTLTDADLATVSPDNANDRADVDLPDQTWTAVTTGATTDLVVCYDNDTTAGADSNLIPLAVLDFPITPDGSDVLWQLNAAGYYRAS